AFPVALLALGVAIVVIRLLPLIPLWASVLPAAVAYAAVLFVTLARQRRGVRLAQWRAFVDRKRARTGVVIQCGTVIDPLASKPLTIGRSRGAPSRRPEREQDLDPA